MAAVTPTSLQAPELLRHTDLIGTFPIAATSMASTGQLVSRDPPVPPKPVELHLVRHRRSDMDAAVTFVAELIVKSAMHQGTRSDVVRH